MHAFLVVGKNLEEINEAVSDKAKEIGGRRVKYKIEGIGEVRELRKYLKLKTTEPMVYVIDNFDQVSVDAQNAFLKALEEPQEGVSFILTARNEDAVLATIKSRCFLVRSGGEVEISKEAFKKVGDFISKSGGEKMAMVSEIKTRDEAVQFITDLIVGGRKLMKENDLEPVFFEVAQQTINNLQKNGNVALQMTNFVIRIAK